MSRLFYRLSLILLAAGFAATFVAACIPPLIAEPDLVAAVKGGFVNPFAAGYALDTIFCWGVLAVWVVYEALTKRIRHGWIALLLGLVPGVATGLATYLLLRSWQRSSRRGTSQQAQEPRPNRSARSLDRSGRHSLE